VVAPKHDGGKKYPATLLKKDLNHYYGTHSGSDCVLQEQKALHYELHKNIALQRRVTISQAEKIQRFQTENADLKKQLSEAQGWFPII
jgi:hypothetical protein